MGGPGGHWQWRIKDDEKADKIRLTSDISLLHDAKYLEIVKEFAGDMHSFNEAFDEAWFDLTTTYGSGTWSKSAKCYSGAFPEAIRSQAVMLGSDAAVEQPQAKSSDSMKFVAVVACMS